MLNVLHITPWYPTIDNPHSSLWIKRHINSIQNGFKNIIWHIEVKANTPFSYKFNTSGNNITWIITLPTKKWIFIEIATFLQLLALAVYKRKLLIKVDIVNFHIAYPSLVFWNSLKHLYKKKIVITEHWSAYHFNFGTKKKLTRIIQIFKNRIPLITVSRALKDDIETFSNEEISGIIIPNVVDTNIFRIKQAHKNSNHTFFMISHWAYPKDPISAINEFSIYLSNNPDAILRIGGYGPLEDEIINYINTLKLASNIIYLGALTSSQIAEEFNSATAFIHISKYETFSVVCAEAICSGCPVIASKVGGIKEFINTSNGVLIEAYDELSKAMNLIESKKFNRSEISRSAKKKFSEEKIGEMYSSFLKNVHHCN